MNDEKTIPTSGLNIEIRDIDSIRPYEKNPRLNDKAVDAVAASLKEFGFRQPIVIDSDSVIIAGHTRWKAAKKLGLGKVPVHVATDLTPEQVRAYRITDNKSGEIAEWDMQILPIEISELQAAGFDMGILAFSEKELTQLLNISTGISQGLTDPDAVPEPPDDPITQKGDIWILGNHRLMCGDSAKPEPGRAAYIWGGYANLANYPAYLKKHGLYFSQCIVWNKCHPVLTRKDFMGAYEICFYCWKEGAVHQFYGPNNVPDLWDVKKLNHTSMIHLTEKVCLMYCA